MKVRTSPLSIFKLALLGVVCATGLLPAHVAYLPKWIGTWPGIQSLPASFRHMLSQFQEN